MVIQICCYDNQTLTLGENLASQQIYAIFIYAFLSVKHLCVSLTHSCPFCLLYLMWNGTSSWRVTFKWLEILFTNYKPQKVFISIIVWAAYLEYNKMNSLWRSATILRPPESYNSWTVPLICFKHQLYWCCHSIVMTSLAMPTATLYKWMWHDSIMFLNSHYMAAVVKVLWQIPWVLQYSLYVE